MCIPRCRSLYGPGKDADRASLHAGNKTVLTTGRDNTLKLYNQSMSELCSVPHNNNTGRWVMPLRATLGPSDTIICGSMKRAVCPSQCGDLVRRLKNFPCERFTQISVWCNTQHWGMCLRAWLSLSDDKMMCRSLQRAMSSYPFDNLINHINRLSRRLK